MYFFPEIFRSGALTLKGIQPEKNLLHLFTRVHFGRPGVIWIMYWKAEDGDRGGGSTVGSKLESKIFKPVVSRCLRWRACLAISTGMN